jgi:hypothetical protein
MAYIYLASPYTSNDKFLRADRYRTAVKATEALMDAGEVVFCPVAYGHSFEQRAGRTFSHAYWIRWSRAMLASASRLYVLTMPGWHASKGIGVEIKLAAELGIPISGYAFGQDSEDVSGIDILAAFGLSVERRQPKFVPVKDRGED